MKRSITQRASAAAFTLVEVALAMGVASFCLVAVLGLVPLGIDTNLKASDQTACSSILTHVLADLRATPMTSPPGAAATSAEYGLKIPSRSGSDAPTTKPIVFATLYFGNTAQQFYFPLPPSTILPVNARYRLTVTYLPSSQAIGTSDKTATGVVLLLTWPPLVDPNDPSTGKPAGRVQMFASLDRN